MELTFTHYRLLRCADSASLPELLSSVRTYGFPQDVEWPAHGKEAAERRGESIPARKRAIRDWERQFGKVVDLTVFESDVLPLICEVPLSRMVKATGLSLRYCSQIRRGEKVPHPRHWLALRRAIS